MNSCPYCGSKVEMMPRNMFYCEFCCLQGDLPSEDGKRLRRKELKHLITLEDAKKSTPELMAYHVFDLLKLLKLLRDERRKHYTTLKVFIEVGNSTDEYKGYEDQAGQGYEWQSRKTWIVENILRDKIGYIPKSVTNKLLAQWCEYMDYDDQRGPMTFKNKTINAR